MVPEGPAQRTEWSEEAEINQQRHAQRRAASRERRRQQDERLQAALSIQRFVSVSDSTSQRPSQAADWIREMQEAGAMGVGDGGF